MSLYLRHGRVYPGRFIEDVRGDFHDPPLVSENLYFTVLLFPDAAAMRKWRREWREREPDREFSDEVVGADASDAILHPLASGDAGAGVFYSPSAIVPPTGPCVLGSRLGWATFHEDDFSAGTMVHESVHMATAYRRACGLLWRLRAMGWPDDCGEDYDVRQAAFEGAVEDSGPLLLPEGADPEAEETVAYGTATAYVQLQQLLRGWGYEQQWRK